LRTFNQHKTYEKILATILIFSAIGLGVIAFGVRGGSARPNANADAFNRGPDVDQSSAVVQLKGHPISTNPSTKPPDGRKIDFKSQGVRSYRAQLNQRRNEFKHWLRSNAPRARVTGEYDVSLNAVAVQLNGTPLATIAAAPMVQSAEYNALYHPTLSESYKIINASDAWAAAGGRATAGAGIKIGDIDTGIDEKHPFFDPMGFSYPDGFPKCDAADSASNHEGAALRVVNPPDASAVGTFDEFITQNGDIAYGNSGQGPTNVDFAVKPDVTSVAVNVLSSITCVGKPAGCPGDGSGWAFFQGTSMATPHIAGSAAVLLQLFPDWSPAQVKSALVNRAELVVQDAVTGTHDVGPTLQGGGRENLSVSAEATTWMDPVSASFGRVTVGHPTPVTITLYNPTGVDQTFAVSKMKFTPSTFGNTVPLIWNAGTITPGDDRITVPASVTVPAEGSTTLTVTVAAGIGATVQGWINLDGEGANDLHFAYYAHVGP